MPSLNVNYQNAQSTRVTIALLLSTLAYSTSTNAAAAARRAEARSPKVELRTYPKDAVTALEVRNTAGDVVITRSTDATATVAATKKEFGKHCRLAIDLKKSLLSVVVSKTTPPAEGSCTVALHVSVPVGTALDLRTGAGDLSAKNLHGGVTFRTGSGDVELSGSFPKIDGKTGSGDVVAYDLIAEDVSIATGSGDIKVAFTKVPALGRVDLKTGSGDTIVTVPRGTKLRSSLLNGSGDVTNEVGNTPGAQFDVSARTGSGDLRLKPAL